MPIATVNGKEFNFPAGTTNEQMADEIDNYFASEAIDIQEQEDAQQEAIAAAPEPKPKAKPRGFFQSISDVFTGDLRNTREMALSPSLIDSGFLSGQSMATIAKIAPLVAMTNDPMEIAQIIEANAAGVRTQFNKDAQGNVYPILVNSNGDTAVVDKPGVDLMNLGQFAAQASAFMIGGPAKNIPLTMMGEGAKESTIQAAQAAGGGSFDAGDVASSSIMGGAFKAAEDIIGAGYRVVKGSVDGKVEQILEAGREFGVDVLTSDLYNPKNWLSRGLQFTGESVPLIGTGSIRNLQQDSREKAVQQFINIHQGGSYEEIISSVAAKNKELKAAAGKVYNNINPVLDAASKEAGGVPLIKTTEGLNEVVDYLTQPGLVADDKILSLVDDMQTVLTGPNQTYQVLRDNIASWQSKIDSVDPAVMSAMPGKVKTKLQGILASARQDRDKFAQDNLIADDYAALKKADAAWGDIASNNKRTKLKGLLDKGDVSPEIAKQMLYSNKASELKLLEKSLTPEGKASARAVIIQDISEALSKRAGGITPTTFVNELKKRQGTVDMFFKGKDKDQLDGFVKLMDYTRRAQEVTIGSGSQTAERLMPVGVIGAAGIGEGINTTLLGGYATVGAISRLFESPRVRGLLIRMNSLEPGSDLFQRAATSFNQLVLAGAQANPDKGQSELSQEVSKESSQVMRAIQ